MNGSEQVPLANRLTQQLKDGANREPKDKIETENLKKGIDTLPEPQDDSK
jgi:hypothetical protein